MCVLLEKGKQCLRGDWNEQTIWVSGDPVVKVLDCRSAHVLAKLDQFSASEILREPSHSSGGRGRVDNKLTLLILLSAEQHTSTTS